jgi:hypothetical protein
MRTVFLFPRAERQETARRLDELAISHQLPGQRTEWVLENLAWIRLDDRDAGLYAGWEPEDLTALRAARGGTLPSWAVVAGSSSRISGQEQVQRLVCALAAPDGHVADEHDGRIWAAAEVASGAVIYGWPGFSRP